MGVAMKLLTFWMDVWKTCIIDYNIFVSLVLASNHVGLVDEGMCYAPIITIYTIPKILKHFTYMVDLFGHVSHL